MQEYEELGHMYHNNEDTTAQRNGISFHITQFSRVPAVQQALALFVMAHVVRVTDSL